MTTDLHRVDDDILFSHDDLCISYPSIVLLMRMINVPTGFQYV